jgi:carotenoid cleavage dioxygenase-like enzyme
MDGWTGELSGVFLRNGKIRFFGGMAYIHLFSTPDP